ncbi:hypothetical protein FPANT_9354 [Fusarium pseudoanthophilum]|uniref:Uncharacterized protein n=1 Tax=Fusarium pseudoanthophilum TaxID=48495 RepID=A0A8H5KX64_9HYPO|nr:hypothetical protein FPANT_9354 [Fusarium pseudoanthophilum]
MADPNESSQFLLQPLNLDTSSSPTPSTRHGMAQSDISGGRRDEATSPTSGGHGHVEAIAGWDDERRTEACTGLLIRETGKDDNASSAKNHQRNIFLVWSLELGLFDELPNGKTGVDITLNALIAVIATIFRATIAFLALEVLAQLKWDWIAKTFRPMGDMQRYDDASRGAWGSLMLLPVVFKRQPQAILAVIVVVASLAIGPVTQQAIQPKYCAQVAPERLASITVANEVDDDRLYYQERPSMWKLHVGLEAAIQEAVVNPSQSSDINDLFDCPSGNCTFNAYPDHPEKPAQDWVSHASLESERLPEDARQSVFIHPEGWENYRLHEATISESMNAMAVRLTTEFRRAGLDAYGNDTAVVEGQGWENRSCLRVAWEWLVLPAVLLLMCMVSMFWLIISDLLSKGNVIVRKGSILPFLLNYKVSTLEKMSLEELDVVGKKFEIKLER